MKIEEGKFYRTRDGRKVGPVLQAPNSELFGLQPGVRKQWYPDGKLMMREERAGDLVEEWPRDSLEQVEAEMDAEIAAEKRGPVRIVTRKEIDEGIFGRLVVGEKFGGRISLRFTNSQGHPGGSGQHLSASDMRAVAATLTEIADALEQSP